MGTGQGRLFRGTDVNSFEWHLLAMIKLTRSLLGEGNIMYKERYRQAVGI